ncbi:MAG: aldo/keto reductase [Spiroplasma phoeniceum]|nr:MAG: aldo/keto reductase [Spiroplasma phoeniceum]UZQ32499.1 MAG: aldo/keto reductase [Spiroplasma phoeniceum]
MRAIKKYLNSNNQRREYITIETKIWCDDIEAENTTNAVLESLKQLNVTYLDIVLISSPKFKFLQNYQSLYWITTMQSKMVN